MPSKRIDLSLQENFLLWQYFLPLVETKVPLLLLLVESSLSSCCCWKSSSVQPWTTASSRSSTCCEPFLSCSNFNSPSKSARSSQRFLLLWSTERRRLTKILLLPLFGPLLPPFLRERGKEDVLFFPFSSLLFSSRRRRRRASLLLLLLLLLLLWRLSESREQRDALLSFFF